MGAKEVCDHCWQGLGSHLVPDSRCPTPGATTTFYMEAYHKPASEWLSEAEES